ncbi:MAG TPA: hypothetical protein VFL91_19850 [Thermomicrobiales bacterium]|nr:hypothetical protein [Thermomicrobiales bacterium]
MLKSRAGAMAFRGVNGLTADGIVGAQTPAALDAARGAAGLRHAG